MSVVVPYTRHMASPYISPRPAPLVPMVPMVSIAGPVVPMVPMVPMAPLVPMVPVVPPRLPQPYAAHMSSQHGSLRVANTSLPDIVGVLEIGQVSDLLAPPSSTYSDVLVTVEHVQQPKMVVADVGPLPLSPQLASELFHTGAKTHFRVFRSEHAQRLSGNVQVIQIRLRVHYCTPNNKADLDFVGITDAIEVSWYADRKVYQLKTPSGHTVGNIYLAHRLSFNSDLQRSLEEDTEDMLDNDFVEWGTRKPKPLKIFSQRDLRNMSANDLRTHAQTVYDAVHAEPGYAAEIYNATHFDKKGTKLTTKPLRYFPQRLDELLEWVLYDVQRDCLKPLMTSRPSHIVKIGIISAKGIKAANKGYFQDGKSDPYVIVAILGRRDSRFETKAKTGTLEPVWNEEFETPCALISDVLRFTIMDKADGVMDAVTGTKNLALGTVMLPIKKINRAAAGDLELPITIEGGGKQGLLRISVQIVKSLSGPPGTQSIDYSADSFLPSQPYLLPGPVPKWRAKSPVPKTRAKSPSRPSAPLHSHQPFAHAHAPVQSESGSPILKISIMGFRNLAGMQASGSGVCVCEIRGKPNSRREGRLETQGNTFEIPNYVGGEVLDFSVFSNQRELTGQASLCAAQFFPHGYDAEMTLSCQRHGITGLLRAKIVVIGAKDSGNQLHYAAMDHLSQTGYSYAEQSRFARRSDLVGASEIETVDRNRSTLRNFQSTRTSDIEGPSDYFKGRSTSMAEGRRQTMMDSRSSFAGTDLPMHARSSFFDNHQQRGSSVASVDPRSSFTGADLPLRGRSSLLDKHQQRGSFLDTGPSSTMYEGGRVLGSRKDIYEEDRTLRQPTYTNQSSILDYGRGVFHKVASFVSNNRGA